MILFFKVQAANQSAAVSKLLFKLTVKFFKIQDA